MVVVAVAKPDWSRRVLSELEKMAAVEVGVGKKSGRRGCLLELR